MRDPEPKYKNIMVTPKQAKILKRLVNCPSCNGSGFNKDEYDYSYGGCYADCDKCGGKGTVTYTIRRAKK